MHIAINSYFSIKKRILMRWDIVPPRIAGAISGSTVFSTLMVLIIAWFDFSSAGRVLYEGMKNSPNFKLVEQTLKITPVIAAQDQTKPCACSALHIPISQDTLPSTASRNVPTTREQRPTAKEFR